jgi:hypothetical protein
MKLRLEVLLAVVTVPVNHRMAYAHGKSQLTYFDNVNFISFMQFAAGMTYNKYANEKLTCILEHVGKYKTFFHLFLVTFSPRDRNDYAPASS